MTAADQSNQVLSQGDFWSLHIVMVYISSIIWKKKTGHNPIHGQCLAMEVSSNGSVYNPPSCEPALNYACFSSQMAVVQPAVSKIMHYGNHKQMLTQLCRLGLWKLILLQKRQHKGHIQWFVILYALPHMLRSMIPRQQYYYTEEIYMNTLQHRNGWVEFDLDFQHWILLRHKLLKLAKRQ